MSILILGDDPLKYRRCEGNNKFFLQDWFAHVEMLAWERAETYYQRPNEIFLVIGQHLSPAFAKSHKRYGSVACQIALEADVEIPNVVSTTALGSFGITRVEAKLGFEYTIKKSDTEATSIEYNIFLHTYSPRSGPLQRFSKRLKTRIEQQYR
jgi:hypothetical protein